MAPSNECVRVVVRCRPLNSTERNDNRGVIVDMNKTTGTVILSAGSKASNEPPKTFTFDAVFPPDTHQEDLYKQTASPIVENVFEGYNGTIFAYGQTGTGKTFSMEGVNEPPELRGIIPRAFHQIFDLINSRGGQNTEFLVRASYLEIYNEEVRDLLSKQVVNKLELKEDPNTGVYVKDLTSYVVKSVKECDKLRNFGANNRHVGATKMNADSSRSHSIYTITVESCETRPDGTASIRMGKLNLVDLAGSERQAKTEATGDRLKEATKINLSLSALGNCISALVDGKSKHIPYRDSKLTRLLQDSLGGNTKTVMVANMGPADWNFDESLSTLRYANRAKNIKNKPKINEDPKDAMLREFQEEIARLKEKLQGKPAGGGGGGRRAGGDEGGWSADMAERETVVEVLREVEVEKLVEVERVIEKPVEVEKIVEVFRDINVIKEVEVEKLVGMREEEVEAMRQQLLEKVRREKEELLNQSLSTQGDVEAQKQTLLEQEERRKAEAEERARIAAEVEQLEGKIMHGGVHVRDRVAQQERELAERERQMEEERHKQVRLEQERAKKEEERLATEEKHSSLAEEAAAKGAKLKQLWSKFRAAQAEIDDLQAEQQEEKEDLLHTVRELTRQLQLQTVVIESFIPPGDVKKLEGRAEWDEEVEEWHLAPLSEMLERESHLKRPVSHPSFRRPTCDFAKQLMADPNAGGGLRFRGDNLLTLDLDMPERTTADYEVDEVQPNVRAALSAALQPDEELELAAEENLPSMMPGFNPARAVRPADKPKKKKKPQKSEQQELDELLMGSEAVKPPEESFPESRGLARRRR